MTVHSYTFLRPEPAQALVLVRAEKINSRLFSSPPVGRLREQPTARRSENPYRTAEVSLDSARPPPRHPAVASPRNSWEHLL